MLYIIISNSRSPGGGNGNPLQYSCLDKPMDIGAWWANSLWSHKEWIQLSNWAVRQSVFKFPCVPWMLHFSLRYNSQASKFTLKVFSPVVYSILSCTIITTSLSLAVTSHFQISLWQPLICFLWICFLWIFHIKGIITVCGILCLIFFETMDVIHVTCLY